MLDKIVKWFKALSCEHDMQTLHRDAACSIEGCKKCGYEVKYGKY